MSTTPRQYQLTLTDKLRHDVPASIVVFLVALPLCMGIAIASGVPVSAGIISGIVGGLVVGAIAGSPLQVSGPAAGLTVIVYGIVNNPSLAPHFGALVIAAGLLQVGAGLLGLGMWFRAVSPAVIQGMLAGIGVIILSQQFHVMLDDQPRGTPLQNILSLPEAFSTHVFPFDTSVHHQAAYLGLLTIGIILIWPWVAGRRLRPIPGPLIAIVAATVVAYVIELPIIKVVISTSLLGTFAWPGLDSLWAFADPAMLGTALTLAVVASAETLLCANAVDRMHTGPRTRYDQELVAQGIGNSVCGLFSALPLTGVIVRSSANVEAGGRSRMSAVLHGVWLLTFVWLLTDLLAHVPRASLAAVLVLIGYKLLNIKALKKLYADSRSEALICVVTVVCIVTINLLAGIAIGFGLALLKLIYTFSHLIVKVKDRPEDNETWLFLHGAATFIRLPQLAAALEQVPPSRELHVFMQDLDYIDHACLMLLMDWERQHLSTGGSLMIDWSELQPRFHRQELATPTQALVRTPRTGPERPVAVGTSDGAE